MITIDLFGEPKGQARPRVVRKRLKRQAHPRVVRKGNFINTYDPNKKLKEGFKWQVKSQFRDEPLTCPVAIDIVFFMPIPKGTSKVKQNEMKRGVIYHIKKPDIDNLEKLAIDVINDIVLKDDSQIVELRAKKVYSDKPGTNIRIIPLTFEKRNTLYESDSRQARQ